jgi:hypothetical protein
LTIKRLDKAKAYIATVFSKFYIWSCLHYHSRMLFPWNHSLQHQEQAKAK